MTLSTQAVAQSTQVEDHRYDSLGRLIVTEVSGLNDGDTRSYCYDQLGNRLTLRASVDGSEPACAAGSSPTPPADPPPPPPPPPPSSSNVPPVADDDFISGQCDTSTPFNLTADDFDAEDDPIKPALISLTLKFAGPASAVITNASTSSVSIEFGAEVGATTYDYTVADSAGATDTAQLTISTMCGGVLE